MNTITKAQENLAKLPEKCFGILPYDNSLIQIVRGETGYYPLNERFVEDGRKLWNCSTNEELADTLNSESGISKAQSMAMQWGSMFGWSHGMANVDRYNEDGSKKL